MLTMCEFVKEGTAFPFAELLLPEVPRNDTWVVIDDKSYWVDNHRFSFSTKEDNTQLHCRIVVIPRNAEPKDAKEQFRVFGEVYAIEHGTQRDTFLHRTPHNGVFRYGFVGIGPKIWDLRMFQSALDAEHEIQLLKQTGRIGGEMHVRKVRLTT